MSGALTQVLASLNPADAVSDFARDLQRRASARGHRTRLVAVGVHPRCTAEAERLERCVPARADETVLVHHSIGTGQVERVLALGGRTVVVHHSVTPAEHFEGVSPAHVKAARRGVEELERYAARVEEAVGVSGFDVAELRAAGFARVGWLPALPPASRSAATGASPPSWLRAAGHRDGDPLVLAVGRLAPNKRVEDLLALGGALSRVLPAAWLVIVGSDSGFEGYGAVLRDMARRVGAPRTLLAGEIPDAELGALYTQATLLVSTSEHEGLGLPLVEAMAHGRPVLALARAAVPETLGAAGILFDRFDALEWAEAVRLIVEDPELRARLVAASEARARDFGPDRLDAPLERLLAGELPAPPP